MLAAILVGAITYRWFMRKEDSLREMIRVACSKTEPRRLERTWRLQCWACLIFWPAIGILFLMLWLLPEK